MNAVASFGDVFDPGFNLCLELVLQFESVFEKVFKPVAQGFLLGGGQVLHLLFNLFEL